jgi:hypothetical protein
MKALVYHGPGRRGRDTVDDPTIIDPTGQCLGGGGWIFGHLIDGLQAEYARVPFADNSVYKTSDELSDDHVSLVTSGRLDPTIFATHRFALDDTIGRLRHVRGRCVHQGAEGPPRGQRARSRLGRSRRGRIRMTPCGLRAAIDMRQETI